MKNERAVFDNNHISDQPGRHLAFQGILQNLSSGALLLDAQGRIIYSNTRAEQILETESERLLNHFFSPSDPKFDSSLNLNLVLRQGGLLDLNDWAVQTPSGQQKCVDLRVVPVFSPEGRIEGAIVDLRDCSEQRHAQDERERLLAELDATINAITDAVIVYKPTGDIVRMNPVARKLLDYDKKTEQKTLSQRLEKVRIEKPDGSDLPVGSFLEQVLTGRSFHGITAVLKKEQKEDAWLQLSAAPVFSSKGEIIAAVGTATDVTELHRAEKERVRGLLMLTHDLRNPLTVIQGHAQLIESRLENAGTEELRDSLSAIHNAVDQMSTMLHDLVCMARIEGDKTVHIKQSIDLQKYFQRFFDTNCIALDCSRIEVDLPRSPGTIAANPRAMERILLNLLSNALKYSPPQHPVHLRMRRDSSNMVFTVRDHGDGIDKNDQHQLFRCFSRLAQKKQKDSLGIGLYIARRLVEAQGGRIWLESDKGQGAAFHFTLPLED